MNKKHLEKIIEVRHTLHRKAELAMRERETVKVIKQFLTENTFLSVTEKDGWLFVVKQGRKKEKRIGFRADMDALPIQETIALPYASEHPGVSHKCGHDGHMAALLALALELDGIETEGTVYLIFQPAEETGQGAEICRSLIQEEGIREIYAFHNLPGYPEGSIVYREGLTQPASEGLKLSFTGKTSHASAPEEGNNPADAMARIVLFLQGLTGKRTDSMLLCTVTGLKLGDGDFGISPGDGEISLTLRAEKEDDMKQLEKGILLFAAETVEALGLKMEYSIHDVFPETRNDRDCLAHVLDAAERLGKKPVAMDRLWRASEDFGYYLKECPGAMFYIGCGETYPALHTAEYDFNDRILETAADMFLAIATREDTGQYS